MTQISFADFFNETKRRGAARPVVQTAPAVQSEQVPRVLSASTLRVSSLSVCLTRLPATFTAGMYSAILSDLPRANWILRG